MVVPPPLGRLCRYRYDCTEDEMLGQLVVDRCEYECMGEVYA